MASNPRAPPFPVINARPGFWQCVDAMSEKDTAMAAVAALAGAAIGIYAGRRLNFAALSPFNLAVTMGITGGTVGVFKGSIHGYERLKGFRDNGLKAVQPEFQQFAAAPRPALETFHHLDKSRL